MIMRYIMVTMTTCCIMERSLWSNNMFLIMMSFIMIRFMTFTRSTIMRCLIMTTQNTVQIPTFTMLSMIFTMIFQKLSTITQCRWRTTMVLEVLMLIHSLEKDLTDLDQSMTDMECQ